MLDEDTPSPVRRLLQQQPNYLQMTSYTSSDTDDEPYLPMTPTIHNNSPATPPPVVEQPTARETILRFIRERAEQERHLARLRGELNSSNYSRLDFFAPDPWMQRYMRNDDTITSQPSSIQARRLSSVSSVSVETQTDAMLLTNNPLYTETNTAGVYEELAELFVPRRSQRLAERRRRLYRQQHVCTCRCCHNNIPNEESAGDIPEALWPGRYTCLRCETNCYCDQKDCSY